MKNFQKSLEAWGNCELGWKPGQGNGKWESSGKIKRVGKYAQVWNDHFWPRHCHILTFELTVWDSAIRSEKVNCSLWGTLWNCLGITEPHNQTTFWFSITFQVLLPPYEEAIAIPPKDPPPQYMEAWETSPLLDPIPQTTPNTNHISLQQ